MSEVDTTQDPNDFAAMATNTVPADSQEQPTAPNPGGAIPPVDPNAQPPVVAPGAPPVTPPVVDGTIPPVTPNVVPGQETKPDTPPAPADSQEQPKVQQTPEEIEKANASQKITELGQEKAKMFDTYKGLIEDNPNAIHDIHKRDPELADKLIQEHWKYDSYDELNSYAEAEALKETDPEKAELTKRILDLERTNKTSFKSQKETADKAFYESKGIINNPFDTKYKAIQDALKNKVNPDLVKSNYREALEIAHSIAFPGKTAEQIAADQKAIALATGIKTPIASGAGGTPPSTPSKHTPAQQQFMQNVGITPN